MEVTRAVCVATVCSNARVHSTIFVYCAPRLFILALYLCDHTNYLYQSP